MPTSSDRSLPPGQVPALGESLRTGASKFARMAVRDHLDGTFDSFFVHGGTALELMLKAYLASIDPVLVADGRSFDSLLHACGRGRHADIPLARMKTISVNEALGRCSQILPHLKNLSESLGLLVAARNGAIHAALVAKEDEETSYEALLEAAQHLIGESGWAEKEFWAETAEAVSSRLTETAEAAAIKVREAVVAGKLRFAEKYSHLGDESREVVLQALVATYAREKYEQQLIQCPACGTQALASGSIKVDWEADFDDGMGHAYAVVTFFPRYLECRACGLELDGQDEIRAAGIDEAWQLEEVDDLDFVDDLYDEDY